VITLKTKLMSSRRKITAVTKELDTIRTASLKDPA
jgi:hypothetical protein